MKKLRKAISIILMTVSIMGVSSIGANAEWRGDYTNGWWYADGSSWAVGWKLIDGKWYYFNQQGWMLSNTTINGYTLGADGAWITPGQSANDKLKRSNGGQAGSDTAAGKRMAEQNGSTSGSSSSSGPKMTTGVTAGSPTAAGQRMAENNR